MSDFLSRLAQCGLGAASLISPRLPSLFAPFEYEGAARGVTGFTSPNVSDVQENIFASSQSASSPSFPSAPAGRASLETENSARTSSLPTEGQGEKTAAYFKLGVPQKKSDDAIFSRDADRSVHPLPNPSPARGAGLVPGDAQNGVVMSNPSFAADESKYAPTSSFPSPRAGEGPGERGRELTAQPPLVPTHKIESREIPAPSAFAADMADRHGSAAPTIHISIGRIDVRANTASPPAPRPRTEPKPTQSLADYLKRGGRQP